MENNNNKLSFNGIEYVYYNKLPEDALGLYEYNGHLFKNYYFDPRGNFYHYNGLRYREITPRKINNIKPNIAYSLRDVKNKRVIISLNKFSLLFGLSIKI